MPHVFDTGAAKAQRSMLFDAIASGLGDLMFTSGKYLRGVSRIARTVRAAVNETHDEFGMYLVEQASQGAMPCVLVAFGDAHYHAQGTDPIDMSAELAVQLLVVSSNLGGFVAGRLTTDAGAIANVQADPGIDTMLEHVEERLMGQQLQIAGVDVDGLHELRWTHVGEIDTFPEYTVWEVRATTLLERHVNPDRAITQLVTQIEVDNELDGIPQTDPPGELDPIVETVTNLEVPTP